MIDPRPALIHFTALARRRLSGAAVLAFADTGAARPAVDMDWLRPARLGLAVVAAAVGGSGAWACLARLDGAAVAPGVVSVATNRKTVQHYEGGIIRDILVRDGAFVTQGQVLFTLDDTQARATRDTVLNQRAAALAEEARLLAERNGADAIAFPREVEDRRNVPAVRKAIEDQSRAFLDRRAYLKAQVDALGTKVAQAEDQLAGAEEAHRSAVKQLQWIDKELPGLRQLYAKGLVQWPRITGLERERAQIEGTVGQSAAAIAQNRQAIDQARIEMDQAVKQMQQDVAERIIDIRKTLSDLAEKQNVAEDVFRRLTIRAPQTGVVQGLKVFTRGAVIRPGDALLDIAPVNEPLVVRAQVSPNDIDVVDVGLRAEIRFPSFHLGYTPFIMGKVNTLSYDRLTDDRTKEPYFAAEIAADPSTIPDDVKERLRAGLPAEVLIATGERTPLEYLLAPLMNRLRSSMREH